ncbi:MAG: hypothetical protein ACYDH0_08230 [Candidatus Aminicenantales bacterium]
MMDKAAQEQKLADILQPSTRAGQFLITLIFGSKITPNTTAALEIARRNPTYHEEGEGEWVRHSVTYSPSGVDDLFELFGLVGDWDDTEVLVNHKNIPYGHSLWLLLMWFYRIR